MSLCFICFEVSLWYKTNPGKNLLINVKRSQRKISEEIQLSILCHATWCVGRSNISLLCSKWYQNETWKQSSLVILVTWHVMMLIICHTDYYYKFVLRQSAKKETCIFVHCRTLMCGDKKGGFSIFWADDGLDTGPILLQREVEIDPDDTVDTLYNRFMYPEGIKAMVCRRDFPLVTTLK